MEENKKYSLSAFGMRKSSMKRFIEGTDAERNTPEAYKLLYTRTTKYTLEELLKLTDFMSRSSHDCVVDNPDDFSPLEVYVASEVLAYQEWVVKEINKLRV